MSEDRGDWQALETELPPSGTTCALTIGDRNLLLCNVGGRAYAIADRCSHANAPLARGRLAGHVLECPLHGGKLDVRDGTPLQNPIRKPVAAYPMRERGGKLEISLQPIKQETSDA
jgi:nitrite reductase/ring-hydroxylating ferredoxin subunit